MAFVIEHWQTVSEFAAHLARHQPPAFARRLIVHHTWKPTVADWRGRRTMESMARYYRGLAWDRGPHLFLAANSANPDDDGIWQMSPLNEPGMHANAANSSSIGVEVVGNYDDQPWSPKMTELADSVLVELARWLKLTISDDTIQPHRQYNPAKTCPGNAIDMTRLRCRLISRLDAAPHNTSTTYTPDADLLGGSRGDAAAWRSEYESRAARQLCGVYTVAAVRNIVNTYVAIGSDAGVDWSLALAQMTHETGWLASWWSQPPRRNMAGIGVTGQAGAGVTFTTFDDAIRAHLGRLIAYARRDDEIADSPDWPASIRAMLALRRQLVAFALAVRPLSDRYRGAYRTPRSLGGSWAVPGDGYGAKLVSIANRFLRRP